MCLPLCLAVIPVSLSVSPTRVELFEHRGCFSSLFVFSQHRVAVSMPLGLSEHLCAHSIMEQYINLKIVHNILSRIAREIFVLLMTYCVSFKCNCHGLQCYRSLKNVTYVYSFVMHPASSLY